jgi:hypothetical protein
MSFLTNIKDKILSFFGPKVDVRAARFYEPDVVVVDLALDDKDTRLLAYSSLGEFANLSDKTEWYTVAGSPLKSRWLTRKIKAQVKEKKIFGHLDYTTRNPAMSWRTVMELEKPKATVVPKKEEPSTKIVVDLTLPKPEEFIKAIESMNKPVAEVAEVPKKKPGRKKKTVEAAVEAIVEEVKKNEKGKRVQAKKSNKNVKKQP